MPSVLRPSALARPGPAGRALSGTRGQGHSHAPRGDLTALDTELGSAGGAPSHLRFLKPCEGTAGGMRPGRRPRSAVRAGSAPGSAAHTRLSAVLSKVAQLESKIMGQKKRLELHNTDSGLGCTSSASGREGGAKGRRYWKNSGATGGNGTRRDACSGEEESTPSPERSVVVKQQLDLDSDEEEMRELMESSLGLSSGSGNQKVLSKTPVPSGKAPPPRKEISSAELSKASSSHNKDSEESVSGRVHSPAPSPTSRNLSGHPTRPRLLSSSMQDSTAKSALPKAGYTKQIQESLESVRSEIKSLDELFSEGTDAEDPSSSSLKYFGLNIMSLDDVAPDTTSKAAELKQKGEDIQFTQESNKYVKKDALQVEEEQAAVKMTSAITAGSDSSAEAEKCVSEAEISEHLSGVSSDFPPHKQDYPNQNESTLNSEYSEDFEGSQSAADGEEGRAEGCSCSGAHPCSGSPPEQHSPGHQVSVTEAAVQTAEPPCSSCWAKAHPAAALAPPVGTSCIDPVPIASHTISPDAVEALSAYSPSALLLHTLCKQHLMLTQQFVQNVHHLHTALVESLEHEKFRYHTLEEAKEYIRNHKSPPLTIEQALEEIRREPRRNNCLDSYCTSSDICIHRAKAETRNLPSCTDKR